MDSRVCFSHHAEDLKTRFSRRHQIVKALTGTSWGQSMETLLLTYKTLMCTLIDYLCPVWYPIISETSAKKLQVQQNAVLRMVTGCHLKTPIEHLHTETKTL
jgi:hypothetical protein